MFSSTRSGRCSVVKNASAFLIRQCLGHKSLSSSMQYVNVSDQDADAMAQKVFMDVF